MFSIFSSTSPDDEMQKAQALFEKVTSSKSDSREARNLRLRMALLCKAHLDKSFVAGAEQMATWQELAASAVANGKKNPLPSEPSVFQIIKAGENNVYVYLPEDYAHEAYFLGARYQRAEIPALEAIDKMQGLADQLCLYELRLSEPFQVLQFLRNELDTSSVDSSTAGLS